MTVDRQADTRPDALHPAIPRGLSPERQSICAEALRHLGVGEVPAARNRGPCERFMPRWQIQALEERDRAAGRPPSNPVLGPPWCAFFACYVWHRAMGRHPLGAHVGSCHEMARRADVRNLWLELGGESADMVLGLAPGDAFVMLDQPYHPARPVQGHTGIVLRVSEDGREWVCVEGNTGHSVRLTRRRIDEPRMRGVISVLGDLGEGDWEDGLGDVQAEDAGRLGTR